MACWARRSTPAGSRASSRLPILVSSGPTLPPTSFDLRGSGRRRLRCDRRRCRRPRFVLPPASDSRLDGERIVWPARRFVLRQVCSLDGRPCDRLAAAASIRAAYRRVPAGQQVFDRLQPRGRPPRRACSRASRPAPLAARPARHCRSPSSTKAARPSGSSLTPAFGGRRRVARGSCA